MASVIAYLDGFVLRDEDHGKRVAKAERPMADAAHGRFPGRVRVLDDSGPASCSGPAQPLELHEGKGETR